MLRGSIGNHLLTVRSESDLNADEGEALVGQCVHKPAEGAVHVAIDPECKGVGLFDTVIHEIAHGGEYVYGLDVPHSVIYTLATAISQGLISTGLVTVEEFEARFRRLIMEAK